MSDMNSTNNNHGQAFYRREYIYRSFERFWHWTQALLIMFLMLTGFEIHGTYYLMGFENAVLFHDIAAWTLIVLIVFTIFWHFATGEWRQYIPTTQFLREQFTYYISGIFKGAPHPVKKTSYNKFNPLQRLTYLGLKIFIMPTVFASGLLYMYYMYPENPVHIVNLEWIAVVHTFMAFALLAFLIVHIYLLSTNDHPRESVVAMITGWEEVEVEPEQLRKEYKQSAVDQSIAGYYRLDVNGNFVDVNKAWLDLYKFSDENQILGQHCSVTRNSEHVEVLNSIIKRVLEGEHIKGTRVQRHCADGSVGYHFLSMNPAYDENEEVIGVEGFILDAPDEAEVTTKA